MPTLPYSAMELDIARDIASAAAQIDPDSDSSDDELIDQLLLAACEPMVKTLKQEVGDERLSIERLQREAAARGTVGDDRSWNTKDEFGF